MCRTCFEDKIMDWSFMSERELALADKADNWIKEQKEIAEIEKIIGTGIPVTVPANDNTPTETDFIKQWERS